MVLLFTLFSILYIRFSSPDWTHIFSDFLLWCSTFCTVHCPAISSSKYQCNPETNAFAILLFSFSVASSCCVYLVIVFTVSWNSIPPSLPFHSQHFSRFLSKYGRTLPVFPHLNPAVDLTIFVLWRRLRGNRDQGATFFYYEHLFSGKKQHLTAKGRNFICWSNFSRCFVAPARCCVFGVC